MTRCWIGLSIGLPGSWGLTDMRFGQVKGTAVCTHKYVGIEGIKLLVVQPLNKNMEPVGALEVAADVVRAGRGDVCVMVKSREASLAMPEIKFVPIDLALIGIINELHVLPENEVNTRIKSGWNQFT